MQPRLSNSHNTREETAFSVGRSKRSKRCRLLLAFQLQEGLSDALPAAMSDTEVSV